ncbi:hypothetical protein RCL1_003072 [Eukaryota sp. TZLM3-RCL]
MPIVPKDVTHLANITVSSAAESRPPSNLTDNDLNTFWQSDGVLPHFINIQLPRRLCVSIIGLYIDPNQDQSYTPSNVSIRAGEHPSELKQLLVLEEMESHPGWVEINLTSEAEQGGIEASLFQVVIVSNYDNGKNCVIRQVKLTALLNEQVWDFGSNFSQYRAIRYL